MARRWAGRPVTGGRRFSAITRFAAAASFLLASTIVLGSREPVTLSIVGTSDLHGVLWTVDGRGGLDVFGGYLRNLRQARARDGGGVILLDAGDTFQGGVESGLSEGALVVDAYHALGYSALAVGNHDFDFGPADRPGARHDPRDDPRGALKARAAQARFPFLAANLIDDTTGQVVAWPNVHPSVLVKQAGIRIGIVGMMTAGAMRATLPLNVRGLRVAPLDATVLREARSLRDRGATVVLLATHAGGWCSQFTSPGDLSSCDDTSEIFELVRALPAGTLDAIVAGHTHAGLAHVVEGVPIIQAYSGGRAFGRVDLRVDARTGRVQSAKLFAPQTICARSGSVETACGDPADPSSLPVSYEGQPVTPDSGVTAAMADTLRRVRELQATALGSTLDRPLYRTGTWESPLGTLYADALREQLKADVALHANGLGGLRADLPAGPITFGALYATFPFDNRIGTVTVMAHELEQILAGALRRGRRGALAISGAMLDVDCTGDGMQVSLRRPDGSRFSPAESLRVVGIDSWLSGPLFAVARRSGDEVVDTMAPTVREVVEDWLRQRGPMTAERYQSATQARLRVSEQVASCAGN